MCIRDRLSQPDAASDIGRYRALMKEYKELEPLSRQYLALAAAEEALAEAKELLYSHDAELSAMAAEQKAEAEAEITRLTEEARLMLLPHDPRDDRSVIMEPVSYTHLDVYKRQDLVISSVLENLLFGALLAVIVLMLFLRDFRPTIIVALSIPISLLLAVVLMHFTGVTLNIISLSGLALGVGMLVDNSIVAIENIYRLRQLGYNAATAAVHGCRQIAGAITASTLTTVCVFVPILFTSGLTRQIFADMGLTIAYSLGASLLVALTLVPALSGKILTRDTAGEKPNRLLNRMIAGYENLLRKVLRHKAPVLLGAVALLIASAVLAVSMGTAFMPEMDSPQVSVSIEMPEDATQSETWAMCDTVLELSLIHI